MRDDVVAASRRPPAGSPGSPDGRPSAGSSTPPGAPRSSSSSRSPSPSGEGGARGENLELPPGTVPEPGTEPLWAALREVRDPELPVSLVDLGIVYGIRRSGGAVEVDLTFTATACPCMGFIQEDVRERLLREPDVDDVAIRVVWDPPWTRQRMTETGRAILRRYGVAA